MGSSCVNVSRLSLPIIDLVSLDLPEDPKTSYPCIFPSTTKGGRCGNPISFNDRSHAKTLLKKLLNSSTASRGIEKDLEQLAELCHCKSIHRKRPLQLKETVTVWDQSLQERISVSSQIPPTRRTTTPTSGTSQLETTIRKFQPAPRQIITRSLTRSLTRELNGDSSAASDSRLPHAYNPHPSAPDTFDKLDRRMVTLIKKPLNNTEMLSGYIYVYTRTDDLPNHYKIGFTSAIPRERLQSWASKCKYQPILILEIQSIHAHRVEKLALTELLMVRKQENYCKTNPATCGRKHGEWVHTSLKNVEEVVTRWVDWIQTKPYDEDGLLEDEWADRADAVLSRSAFRRGFNQGMRWGSWVEEGIKEEDIEDENSEDDGTEDFKEEKAKSEDSKADTEYVHSQRAKRSNTPGSSLLGSTIGPSTSTDSQQTVYAAIELLRRAGILNRSSTWLRRSLEMNGRLL
jgi:hypothetical protein